MLTGELRNKVDKVCVRILSIIDNINRNAGVA